MTRFVRGLCKAPPSFLHAVPALVSKSAISSELSQDRATVPAITGPRPRCVIAAMLKAIHAGDDIVAARRKAVQVIEKLRGLRLTKTTGLVERG